MVRPNEKISVGDWIEGKTMFFGVNRRMVGYVARTIPESSFCYAVPVITFNNSKKKIELHTDTSVSSQRICYYSDFSVCDIKLGINNIKSLIELSLRTNDKVWFMILSNVLKRMMKNGKKEIRFTNNNLMKAGN